MPKGNKEVLLAPVQKLGAYSKMKNQKCFAHTVKSVKADKLYALASTGDATALNVKNNMIDAHLQEWL